MYTCILCVLFVYLPLLFCSYFVVLCYFYYFVCTSVGQLPPGESPTAVSSSSSSSSSSTIPITLFCFPASVLIHNNDNSSTSHSTQIISTINSASNRTRNARLRDVCVSTRRTSAENRSHDACRVDTHHSYDSAPGRNNRPVLKQVP